MKKLMLLALGFVLMFMFMAPTNSLAGSFIGKYCFMIVFSGDAPLSFTKGRQKGVIRSF